MLKFLGIIPARYASTRFPAKPLAMLGGKTVIREYKNKWQVFWTMLMWPQMTNGSKKL